jgi:hypothetical protein
MPTAFETVGALIPERRVNSARVDGPLACNSSSTRRTVMRRKSRGWMTEDMHTPGMLDQAMIG